jgi:adenosine deaminase
MKLIIDTHRHLGGSIPSHFVWEVIQNRQLWHIANSWEEVKEAMTFAPGEPKGFYRFLDKFRILDEIPWDKELIDLSIKAVCEQLALENIDYCWMDFSINKYMSRLHMSRHDVVQFIYELFQKYRHNQVGLILSLKYESHRADQIEYAKLIEDKDVARCLIGIDLVGDEEYFDADFYATLLPQWRERGKMVRTHVAESQHAQNALDSINKLHVTNIAHGLKLMDHPKMIDRARQKDITFDMGVSSNYLTGVWEDENRHPIMDMLKAGLKVTFGTDDPVQCSTDMRMEHTILRYWFGVSPEDLNKMTAVAVDNSRYYDPRLLTHFVFEELQLDQ